MNDFPTAIEGFVAHLHVERNLAVNTRMAYSADLHALATYARAHSVADPTCVTQGLLRDFLRALAQKGRAATTQARVTSAVRQFFAFLEREHLITQSPAMALRTPKWRRHLPYVPSVQELTALMAAPAMLADVPRALRDTALLELLYGCGLRASEVCGLNLDDVQQGAGLVRARGKGRKERLVPMGPCASAAVAAYVQRGRARFCGQAATDLLFPGRGGRRPMTRMALYNGVRLHAQVAGLPATVSPHVLRHAFATHLLTGGAHLRAVQEMLGHASIATTEIYTHITPPALQDTVQAHHPLGSGAQQACATKKNGL